MPDLRTRRRARFMPGLGSSGVSFSFREEFTTAIDPLDSPHTSQPGSGTLTVINTDAAGVWQLINDALKVKVAPTTVGMTVYKTLGVTRSAGYAFFFKIRKLAAQPLALYMQVANTTAVQANDSTVRAGISVGNSSYTIDSASGASVTHDAVAGEWHYIAIIATPTAGMNIIVRVGTRYARPTLVCPMLFQNTTPIFPTVLAVADPNTLNAEIGFFREAQLPAPFTGVMSTFDLASPASGTITPGDADGTIIVYATMPGAPSANQVALRVRYRRQDTTNYWEYYIKRNAGNTAWDVFLDSVVAGTPTNRRTVTGLATIFGLYVFFFSSFHKTLQNTNVTGARSDVGSGDINNSTLQTAAGTELIYDAATTVSRMIAQPALNSAFDSLAPYWDFLT